MLHTVGPLLVGISCHPVELCFAQFTWDPANRSVSHVRKQISTTFAALAKQHGGYLGKEQALELLSSVGMEGKERHEAADLLWTEMRLSKDAHITEVLYSLYTRHTPT